MRRLKIRRRAAANVCGQVDCIEQPGLGSTALRLKAAAKMGLDSLGLFVAMPRKSGLLLAEHAMLLELSSSSSSPSWHVL